MKEGVMSYREIDEAIEADAMAHSEAGLHVLALCDDIGTRFAGTEGDRQAACYIESKLQAYGLSEVHQETFPFTAWRRGAPARLTLQDPRQQEFPCYALPYGAATGDEGIEAGWVDVGSGDAAAIAACSHRLAGTLALTDGTGGHRKEIQARCAAAGAVGVLHGHLLDGMLLKTGSVADGCTSPIPAVGIPSEVLAALRRFDGKGQLRLYTDGACEPATTSNVVGELRGYETPDAFVLIGGHYDSHDLAPGAYDNATGVSIVMEAARLLQPFQASLKRRIRFVAFAAEEMGLLGSHHHAREHAAELRHARMMFNCDTPCLGHPHGLAFHRCAQADEWVQHLSQDMGEEVLFANRFHSSSDHYPFLLQGVITAGIGGRPGQSRGAAFYHTAADTPDKLVMEDIRDTAAFVAKVLYRVAQVDAWPLLQHDAGQP